MIKFKISIVTLLTMLACAVVAQSVGSFGNTYIHENAEVGLHSKLIFNNNGMGTYPGIIITNRNSQNPGVFSFAKNATWENADDFQHIDGFVKVYGNDAFTFPVGNLGNFKPLSISGASGTMVAYSYDNPVKLPFVNTSTSSRSISVDDNINVQVTDVEYWDLRGSNETKVTLYWDTNSAIGQLTNEDLTALTIVGWNGSSWKVLSSSVDDNVLSISDSYGSKTSSQSTVNNGSITTDETIVPDDYDVITFGVLTDVLEENGQTEFGSELVDENIEFTVFPNPAVDLSNVNIDYNLTDLQSDATLMIFNSVGEIIYKQTILREKSILEIPFRESTSGIYHIGILTEQGSKVFKPVVITDR